MFSGRLAAQLFQFVGLILVDPSGLQEAQSDIFVCRLLGAVAKFLDALSLPQTARRASTSPGWSAPTSRAVSRKRLYCSRLSGFGAGLRGICKL
jgi:hypothetical protein